MTNANRMLAPVAIFAYTRPQHVAQLLTSLAANPESRDTDVYVFSDGPKVAAATPLVDETRETVRHVSALPRVTLIERERNLGLSANVIDGVTQLTRKYGRVIVLEDDLVISPTFLRYMNDALDRYEADPRVFHVSGFMFPLDVHVAADALFLPFINSSGWATWSRAWDSFDASAQGAATVLRDAASRRRFDLDGSYTFSRMLRDHLAKRNNSWAIRWYLSMYCRNGLALYPKKSLTENRGFGKSATHTDGPVPFHASSKACDFRVEHFPPVEVDEHEFARVRTLLKRDTTIVKRGVRKLLGLAGKWKRRLHFSERSSPRAS